MCLSIIAQIPKDFKSRVGAKRLSELTELHVSKTKFNGDTALHISVTGGCSCDFLGESYDAEAPIWVLNPKHLPKLLNAITIIRNESKSFLFLAHFLGSERPQTELKTTFSELENDLKNNAVKNNTVYFINN